MSSVNIFKFGIVLIVQVQHNLILFDPFLQMLIVNFLCYSILFSYIMLFLTVLDTPSTFLMVIVLSVQI